jgi:RNA recognition motif-containing protein
VFVNNLPFTVTEAMIRDHFKAVVGDLIEEVRLIRGPTGQVKGFAYVQLRERRLVS